MWFGNLVTMRWWDDLWLNESFAELMGLHTVEEATEYDGAWADFALARKAWGYRADSLPTTHPIAGVVPDNRAALMNFDGISYAKGAAALRQLWAWIGEDVFFAGVRRYLDRHAWGNTSLADLLAALEEESGRDLDAWSSSWLRTAGTSTLRVRDGLLESDDDRPHLVGVGRYTGLPLRRVERLDVEVPGSQQRIEPADLVLPNDGDLTFAKVRLDERSLATVQTSLHTLDDPVARSLVWGSLWDAARDAELVTARLRPGRARQRPGRDGPRPGRRAPRPGPHRRRAVGRLRRARGPPARARGLGRDRARQRPAARLPPGRPGDRARRPGPARRAARGRGAALAPAAPAGRARAGRRATSSRRRTPRSPRRPPRTTWPTRAPRSRTRPRRPPPGPSSPEPATSRPRGPARSVRASGRPGQDDLLADYVERYVADVPGIWRRRSPELAAVLTGSAFPSTIVAPSVVERTAVLTYSGLRRRPAPGRPRVPGRPGASRRLPGAHLVTALRSAGPASAPG